MSDRMDAHCDDALDALVVVLERSVVIPPELRELVRLQIKASLMSAYAAGCREIAEAITS